LKILMIFIMFFPVCVFSLSGPVQQISLLYMPQGIVIESLANNGGKSTNSIVSEIGASNPASLYDFSKFSAGLSYQYDTKINEAWLFEYDRNRIVNFIPQSVGLVIPEGNWRFAVSMNQIYNNEIDYGILEATMVWQNPQGYMDIDELNPKRREYILNTSIITSYIINDFIKKNDKLIFGLQGNFNFLKYELIMSESDKFSKNANAFNFAPGIIYEFAGNTFSRSRIGLYYESKLDLNKTFNTDFSPYELIAILPHKLHLGVYHPCGANWRYAANISYLIWNDVNENIENQVELSATAGYLFSKNFQLNFGFFSTDKKYKNNDPGFELNKLSAIYLTLSVNYKIDDISFDFSFADSHLMSDEWRKQTIFKIGTGYSF
jgi:hypothetical protein